MPRVRRRGSQQVERALSWSTSAWTVNAADTLTRADPPRPSGPYHPKAQHRRRTHGPQAHQGRPFPCSPIALDLMEVRAEQDAGGRSAHERRARPRYGRQVPRRRRRPREDLADEERACGQWPEGQEAQGLTDPLVAQPEGGRLVHVPAGNGRRQELRHERGARGSGDARDAPQAQRQAGVGHHEHEPRSAAAAPQQVDHGFRFGLVYSRGCVVRVIAEVEPGDDKDAARKQRREATRAEAARDQEGRGGAHHKRNERHCVDGGLGGRPQQLSTAPRRWGRRRVGPA
mmetsp:Transcript_12390/g.45169  ORF Transcript_12390/g.45169 Transcript_12390/m.45169 type:complete len:287 (-) Transcript_12390:277-1137(-)